MIDTTYAKIDVPAVLYANAVQAAVRRGKDINQIVVSFLRSFVADENEDNNKVKSEIIYKYRDLLSDDNSKCDIGESLVLMEEDIEDLRAQYILSK